MPVMADLGWQGIFTLVAVVLTLAMLLWERFSPDKVMVVAAAALMASGVLTPAVLFVLVAALKTTTEIGTQPASTDHEPSLRSRSLV